MNFLSSVLSIIKKIISVIVYRPEASNDVLEAYPERLHVEALPERRYLKTSRFLVIVSLLSITLNFSLTFIFMRNASLVHAIVEHESYEDTFLYQLDTYHKELKAIQRPSRDLDVIDLIFQNLITDYLTERYQMTINRAEMEERWGRGGKVFLYAPKLYEPFLNYANESLSQQARGITKEIYIYSIRNLGGNLYESIYDVYSLDESGYEDEKCPCKEKTQECLLCMRETAVAVNRYKTYMRVRLVIQERPAEEIRENKNPYYFLISSFHALPQAIHVEKQWEDVDNIIP